ncbi:Hsp20/alpha crystallin family protein [Candidatus Bipolaricaulota bacterium]|nr:Hsp20/alpha crystallin family protein [Candidatus Bipolaricaulota bacterium]
MVLPSDRDRNRKRDRVPSPFGKGGFLDDLFQDLEDSFFRTNSLGRFGNTDIYEKNGKLHYRIELPGLTKDQISIRAKDNQLIVSGEVERNENKEDVNYISRGRRYGRFKQSFGLPEEVEDPDQLKAKFENGVLHIQADLSESLTEEKAVDIEIE